jgi:hypothetical protein
MTSESISKAKFYKKIGNVDSEKEGCKKTKSPTDGISHIIR